MGQASKVLPVSLWFGGLDMSVTKVDLRREQDAHAETRQKLAAARAQVAKLQSEVANVQPPAPRVTVSSKGDAVKIAALTAECDMLRRELDSRGD